LFLLSLALHPRSPLLFRTTLLGYALSPLGVLALTPLLRQLFSSLLLSLLTPSNTLTPAYGTLGLLIDLHTIKTLYGKPATDSVL